MWFILATNLFSSSLSRRTAYSFLLISALVVLPSYSGSIVSFLTANKAILPFRSLPEMAEQGIYKITTRSSHYVDYIFRVSSLS